jgi:hypothetical protein
LETRLGAICVHAINGSIALKKCRMFASAACRVAPDRAIAFRPPSSAVFPETLRRLRQTGPVYQTVNRLCTLAFVGFLVGGFIVVNKIGADSKPSPGNEQPKRSWCYLTRSKLPGEFIKGVVLRPRLKLPRTLSTTAWDLGMFLQPLGERSNRKLSHK